MNKFLHRGQEAVDNGCTEMHIVGGLHHKLGYDWYRGMIEKLHTAYPKLHLKGWTAVEINWFEFLTKMTSKEILTGLEGSRAWEACQGWRRDFSS